MPLEKLNTAQETTAQSPHNTYAERAESVLGARLRVHKPSANPTAASGNNQAICPPTTELNRRPGPAAPPNVAPPPPPPGPPAPPSPDTRPKPLAPKISENQELSVVSPTQGRSRDQHHRPIPSKAHRYHRGGARQQLSYATPHVALSRDQQRRRQRRHDQIGLQHLHVEGQPHQHPTKHHFACAPRLQSPHHRPSGRHLEQHQQRVRVVVAAHRHEDRRQRQHRRRQDRRPMSERALDRVVQHEHSADAAKRLGQQHAEAREAQQSARQPHHHVRQRPLVQALRAARVERVRQPSGPVAAGRLSRLRVIGVRVPTPRQAPQRQNARHQRHQPQRRARPSRIGLLPADQATPARPSARRLIVPVGRCAGRGADRWR